MFVITEKIMKRPVKVGAPVYSLFRKILYVNLVLRS